MENEVERKEEKEKNNVGLYVIIIVLFALLLSLVGYIIYDKTQNNNVEEKNIVDSTNTNNDTNDSVSKIDNNKEWVYDAEYEKNVNADSYSTAFETYYAKDIVVPYINVKSSDADIFNNDIKIVFDDAIKTYNNGVSDHITYVEECNYKKYINNDNLSIILTYGVGATDVVHPKYYTYNINLKTGNQLSYEEVYKIAGFTSSDINSKVEDAITKVMNDKMSSFSSDNYPNGTNFDTYNSQSINNYKTSINNNTLKYYLSDDGKLNVVVKLSIPAGIGEFDTIVTID